MAALNGQVDIALRGRVDIGPNHGIRNTAGKRRTAMGICRQDGARSSVGEGGSSASPRGLDPLLPLPERTKECPGASLQPGPVKAEMVRGHFPRRRATPLIQDRLRLWTSPPRDPRIELTRAA